MGNTVSLAGKPSAGWRVLGADTRERYSISEASTPSEMREAQQLRFEVFNLELQEGLVTSFVTGRDEDPFDVVCNHLLVRETATEKVVGTYRYQTGWNALACRGYYSDAEFDLASFETRRAEILELGRACVHAEHRNLRVLAALWRGIAAVAARHRSRLLIGCSSLTSTHMGEGLAAYRQLAEKHLAPPQFRAAPRPTVTCRADEPLPPAPRVPKLLAAYLSLGAWIAGPPAIDREFGTIDFLTVLDLKNLNPEAARLYLGPQWPQLLDAFAA